MNFYCQLSHGTTGDFHTMPTTSLTITTNHSNYNSDIRNMIQPQCVYIRLMATLRHLLSNLAFSFNNKEQAYQLEPQQHSFTLFESIMIPITAVYVHRKCITENFLQVMKLRKCSANGKECVVCGLILRQLRM
uniref:Uncharacterized protein n=1 Tax=Glossina pallidipes TaxID=7398 RepID=A0A1A9ZR00_GLOPL